MHKFAIRSLLAAAGLILAATCALAFTVEDRSIPTLSSEGTGTQPYTKYSPSGNPTHYYVQGGNRDPYAAQNSNRVGPPVGFGPNTVGNWYGTQQRGFGYPQQDHLDLYTREPTRARDFQ
jgi:hypothetical protein